MDCALQVALEKLGVVAEVSLYRHHSVVARKEWQNESTERFQTVTAYSDVRTPGPPSKLDSR
jgi:hypothetical protein